MVTLKGEELERERHIKELAIKRDNASRQVSVSIQKQKESQELVKMKELVGEDLKKARRDTVRRVKDFQQLYELVKNQRNKFVNLIQVRSVPSACDAPVANPPPPFFLPAPSSVLNKLLHRRATAGSKPELRGDAGEAEDPRERGGNPQKRVDGEGQASEQGADRPQRHEAATRRHPRGPEQVSVRVPAFRPSSVATTSKVQS